MRLAVSEFDPAAYRAWLSEQGAIFLAPTNEYEVIRYKIGERSKLGLVYSQPTKRRFTICGTAAQHLPYYQAGKALPFAEAKRPGIAGGGQYTIYTDAGYYPESKTGSWAAILICPDGSEIEASGALKDEISSSTAAEMMAVANAVHHFAAKRALPQRAALRIICDNIQKRN